MVGMAAREKKETKEPKEKLELLVIKAPQDEMVCLHLEMAQMVIMVVKERGERVVALLVLLVSQELLAGGDTLELLADKDLQDLQDLLKRTESGDWQLL